MSQSRHRLLSATTLLSAQNLSKSFGEKVVLHDASFQIPEGSVTCVLGKSGSGKSVLLRLLVGLLQPDSGNLTYNNAPLNQSDTLQRFRAETGYVFQHNALLDFLTVAGNVGLPLVAQGSLPPNQHPQRIAQTLAALELETEALRYPSELSGGMQKRVAVARALVTNPKLVLFDEPTAGLDPIRRNAVFQQILKLRDAHHFTAVIVTHDVPEALAVADQILWVDQRTIRFNGHPDAFRSLPDADAAVFRDNVPFLAASAANPLTETSRSE
jgi:phospholipid/cholesterol/gamma-HCH transport system ATP-binding protein